MDYQSAVASTNKKHAKVKNFLMKVTLDGVDYQSAVASTNKKHAKVTCQYIPVKFVLWLKSLASLRATEGTIGLQSTS